VTSLGNAGICKESCEALLHQSRNISDTHCHHGYDGKGRIEIHVKGEYSYDEYSKGRREGGHFRARGQEGPNCYGCSLESVWYPHVKRDNCHFYSEPNDEEDNGENSKGTNVRSGRRERTCNCC